MHVVTIANYKSQIKKDDFKHRVAHIWTRYFDFVFPSMSVYRSGYALCGVYPPPTEEQILTRFQSDAEHMYSVSWLASAICDEFPELAEFSTWRAPIVELLLMHDLMESKIGGDIPDVSERDNVKKDAGELSACEKYCQNIAAFPSKLIMDRFREFQVHASSFGQICYCLDKIDGILMGLCYERRGLGGSVRCRTFKSDLESMQIVGHDALVDNWFYNMIAKIHGFNCGDFFIRFLEESIVYARSWPLDWIASVDNYQSWNL